MGPPPSPDSVTQKPTSWAKFGNSVGQTCIDALATPARLLGCGPSRQDMFEMRLEAELTQAGLEHLYVERPCASRTTTKKLRFLDASTGQTSKQEKFVWSSQPFHGGADGEISLVGTGKARYYAAKSFRGREQSAHTHAAALREAHLLREFGDASARVVLDENGRAHLLMRLAAGSLHDLGRGISAGKAVQTRQSLARKMLREVAEQLANMHEAGYAHRDVKPGNILCYDDGALRLADFGRARAYGETARSGTTGTPAYAPLEVLYCDEGISAHSDTWSLGMALLNTLVSLEEAPSRIGPARSSAAVTALILEDLLELRAAILKDGSIDQHALDASKSSWAPYLRKVLAADGALTLHILESMVAPLQERQSTRELAYLAAMRFPSDDFEEMAMQKLCGQKSQHKDSQRAMCAALDCAHEAFVQKRVY